MPLLIPSARQGPDESRSEGEAMADHLITRRAPPPWTDHGVVRQLGHRSR